MTNLGPILNWRIHAEQEWREHEIHFAVDPVPRGTGRAILQRHRAAAFRPSVLLLVQFAANSSFDVVHLCG